MIINHLLMSHEHDYALVNLCVKGLPNCHFHVKCTAATRYCVDSVRIKQSHNNFVWFCGIICHAKLICLCIILTTKAYHSSAKTIFTI